MKEKTRNEETIHTLGSINNQESVFNIGDIASDEGKTALELKSDFDKRIIKKVIMILSVACSAFHLYTAGFGVLPTQLQRAWHLTFVLSLIFLVYSNKQKKLRALDYLLSITSIVMGGYIIITYNSLMFRVGNPNMVDIIFGCILVVLVLDATRRTSGWTLVIISLISLVYAAFGHLLPGLFAHRQYSIARLTNTFYIGGEGLFGVTMGVAATYIVTFVIFSAFLSESGATKAFMDFAFAIAGRFRGGPAKIAVISSALMGTVSGSAVANVMATGVFTIPLMKKLGYRRETAGAIEAVASSGGAIMPPVMGAGAFVMSEMTGIPYSKILIAAIVPALLYYSAIFLSVDFEARKLDLKGIPKEELPPIIPTLKKSINFFIPLIVLVYYICIAKISVLRSAFYAILSIIVFNILFGGENRMTPIDYLSALVNGARGTLMVSCACCCVGLVVGTVSLTGIGLMMTSFLLNIASNSLIVALLMIMIISIIMGMALPATPSYIIVSVITVPAMVKAGVPLLAAHLFVFYFCVMAPITPPVCIASFAAASIAKADPMKTGLVGFRFAITTFLCAFLIIYYPTLILEGQLFNVATSVMIALVGTVGLAAFNIGWLRGNLTVFSRVLVLISGLLMIMDDLVTSIIGLCLLLLIFFVPKSIRLFKKEPIITRIETGETT